MHQHNNIALIRDAINATGPLHTHCWMAVAAAAASSKREKKDHQLYIDIDEPQL